MGNLVDDQGMGSGILESEADAFDVPDQSFDSACVNDGRRIHEIQEDKPGILERFHKNSFRLLEVHVPVRIVHDDTASHNDDARTDCGILVVVAGSIQYEEDISALAEDYNNSPLDEFE